MQVEGTLDLARAQLALDLDTGESTAAGRRGVTVFVHVSDPVIARYGRHLISVEQVVAWCQAVGTKVTVKPVRDLNHGIRVDQYEVPDRIVEHVELRDGACRFPLCTRPAERCDKDHVVPWRYNGAGGETDSDNNSPAVSYPPQNQDPQQLALPSGRARRLPVDQPTWAEVPRRPHRHGLPRRPRTLSTQPRTPPAFGGGIGALGSSGVSRKLLTGGRAQGACSARRRCDVIPGCLASAGTAAGCVPGARGAHKNV